MPRAVTGRPVGRPRKSSTTSFNFEFSGVEPASIPDIPEDLSETGAHLWTLLWAGGADFFKPADAFVIRELCQVFEEKEFVRTQLATGAVPRAYKAKNGQLASHPFVSQLAALRALINSLSASLGLSPADRARLGVMDALTDDPAVAELYRRMDERKEERRLAREGVSA